MTHRPVEVDATCFEIDSNFGHAGGPEWPQRAPTPERFLLTLRQ
jgi:hypothetical protein